jgi:hypothetical protein
LITGIIVRILTFFDKTVFFSIENRKEHMLNLFTSSLYFAITFIALHYIGHAWSTSNAHLEGYTPLFSYNGMDSLLGTTGWSARKIGFIFLMPPLAGIIALIVGLISLRLARTKHVHFRTFMFWLSLNGLLMYASYVTTAYLSGLNFNSKFFTGFVSLYAWFFWKDITIYGLLLIQTLLCIPILLYFGRLILSLNYSNSLLKQKNGRIIIWTNVVVIPFVIGVLIVVAATIPMDLGYQLSRIATFFPMSVIMIAGMHLFSTKNIVVVKGGMNGVSVAVLIATTALLILLVRTVLSISTGPLW